MGGSAPVPARVRVKICGVTRPEDAAVAVTAGASFLGVVFAGGPRRIDAERARAVVAAAADVPVIGVFDDRPVDEILATAREVGLRGVQLHGGSDAETARRLRRAGLMVLRVARLAGRADLERLDRLVDAADAVVVEPRVPGRLGGTGVALDLGLAREARRRLAGAAMVLAGGLTPET
ncbi:MAG TPA: phosphoribosylanthranilate isomerase, partial [Gemmatimonadales bacterium]|nr:phosphoribosylanthranilate isomerase [Gemmatimonadales bacterium]